VITRTRSCAGSSRAAATASTIRQLTHSRRAIDQPPLPATPTSTQLWRTGSVKTSGTTLQLATTTPAQIFVRRCLLICVVMALSPMALTTNGTLQSTPLKILVNIAMMVMMLQMMAALTALLTMSGSAWMTLVMTSGASAVADQSVVTVLSKPHTLIPPALAFSTKSAISAAIITTVMCTTMLAVPHARRREPLQASTCTCGSAPLLELTEMLSQLAPSFAATVCSILLTRSLVIDWTDLGKHQLLPPNTSIKMDLGTLIPLLTLFSTLAALSVA